MTVVFGEFPSREESDATFGVYSLYLGQLVGTFTDYFTPGTSITASDFQDEVDDLTLYLVYLFIGKFVLSYISMVCGSLL